MNFRMQLDTVLKYMRKNELVNINEFCINRFPGIKGTEIDDIIRELKQAHFIYEWDSIKALGKYNLTRSGKVFEGYVYKRIKERISLVLQSAMSFFIAIAALATISLAYFEYVKFTERKRQSIEKGAKDNINLSTSQSDTLSKKDSANYNAYPNPVGK